MGTDFLPRLTAIAENREECNRTANEQVEVGLLIAIPGVVLVLAFAPLIIRVLYSDRFTPAIELLRWFSLGMLVRVASWPLGFILVAKGARKYFLLAELSSNVVYVLLVWAGIKMLGLVGAGMAFFGFYLFSMSILYLIVHRLSGFRWSFRTLQLARVWAPLIVSVFGASYIFSPGIVMFFGAVVAAAAAGSSLRTLGRSFPAERIPLRLRKLLGVMRVCPAP